MSIFVEEQSPWYKEEVDLNHFLNFVASRVKISKSGKKINNVDSKVYYKLRHNLLKTYVLNNLGFESYNERPFNSFPQLGLTSIRTPDFIIITDDNCLLIEFTFCNRYENVLKTKEVFSKYDSEKRLSNIPIDDYYVFMSLDKNVEDTLTTIYAISAKYQLPISENFRTEMEDVLNTVLSVTAYLNDFLPSLLLLNLDIVNVDLTVTNIVQVPEAFRSYQNLVGRKAVKNVRVKSLLKRFNRRLTLSLRKKPDWGSYVIVINFVTNNCYVNERPDAANREALLNMLDLQSNRLLDYCEVVGDVYLERDILLDRDPSLTEDEINRPIDENTVVDTTIYEDLFKKKLFNEDMDTVADNDLSIVSGQVFSFYNNLLEQKIKNNNVLPYKSSPFIFYPCDTLVKGKFSVKFDNPTFLTNQLIKHAFGKNVSNDGIIKRTIDYDSLEKLNTLVAKQGLELRKKYKLNFKLYSTMRRDLFQKEYIANPDLEDFKNYRQLKSEYRNSINEETRQAYENRLKMNLKRDFRWDLEMEHFKKTKNQHRIAVGLDLDIVRGQYQKLLYELYEQTDVKTTDSVYSDTKPIGGTLADNCRQMRVDLDNVEDIFRHTRLAHSCLFVSQWCYSLMFYSNIKLNKDDFIYDNLGYTDTLLMVKGGKKIRSTRTSRLFRLLFPITQSQSDLIRSNSNTIFSYNNKLYCLTPWTLLRMNYLKKGFEIYNNFGNYYITSYLESSLTMNNFNKFMGIKTLLMFSQKRKLEIWFSSLRYIYFNSLGTHTDLKGLLKDMPILPYDSLIFLFQESFVSNYPNILKNVKVKKLFDLLWLETVDNFELMVERFEENLFMAKAPFNPVSEHLKNLKSVFDTHKYFMEGVGTLDPIQILQKTDMHSKDNYFKNLDSFDFNFDSRMSYIVGDFCGNYFSASVSKPELTERFNDILIRSYTEISTSKGMRSDTTKNFTGEKGHDIVFGNIDINPVKIINEFPTSYADYNKLIKETEKSFAKKISEIDEPLLLFDMKDKEQYKGSREIYVMSHNTKLMQNPLEKFFGKLCTFFPNELIHKPSGVRPKFIHSKMFEHINTENSMMYCTMDCRKWAPRSNLWKYYFFVQGMAKYLPKNFVDYFFTFWSLMFKKRIRFQKHYIDKLITNEGYKWIKDVLITSSDETYDLEMPYSFMMGIFNYLSSLMHATSQIYFAEKIASTMQVDCNFVAHSDDSAGILVAKNYKKCLLVFKMYEKFQRSLNHLMSRKKCSLSKRSFEIISIMYCDREFIPMTHKFLSNVSFDPKGAGWYDDIAAVTGKIVDLYNNGGSYLQCYGLQLTLSELLRKAYHLPRTELLSLVPLALGGVHNYHPVHSVLIGTKAQECLLDLIETTELRSMRIKNYITLTGNYNPTIGNKGNYIFPYFKRHEDLPIMDDNSRMKLSAISSLPQKNTLISTLKHYNKLFDRQYVYSLTGVDVNQITLNTLFYSCSMLLINETSVSLKAVVQTYVTLYKTKIDDEILSYTYPMGNYMSYFKQTEALKIDYSKVNIIRQKTCKPVVYNTLENFSLRLSQENMMILSSLEKWPEIKQILNQPDKYQSLKDYLMNSLPGSEEEKIDYIKNFDPSEKEDRIRSGYLFIPSQVKIDTPSRFFTYSLLYTTRRHKISSQKPQLFTPTEFSLENRGFEHLKHEYLCFKLIKKYINDSSKLKKVFESLNLCNICSKNSESSRNLKTYQDYFNNREFKDFTPTIPFCDYINAQIKGKNVWYSSSDFKIYTVFGTVESYTLEGDIWTKWTIPDQEHLQALWGIYRIFCTSRGINYEKPTHQDTGLTYPRVAFTDFDTPYVPATFSKAVVLPHSQIVFNEIVLPKVYRNNNKFLLNDRVIDFEIYAVYDISQRLYNSHNLKGVKELVYTLDVEIGKDNLIDSFDDSKLYKVTLQDEFHFSSASDKYVRTGMLGSAGSFTRALTLADEKKITRYRTSYNPSYILKGAIEFDTVEGVPILDMFSKVNYSRMKASEKLSFEKAISGIDLTAVDKQNLVSIKNKMGLESLGTALVLHKHIFRNMIAGSMSQINVEVLLEFLNTVLITIHNSMESFPRSNVTVEYSGSPSGFWIILKTMLDLKSQPIDFAILISRAILRSKSDNQIKFWSEISNNVLLSSMLITKKNFLNLISMFQGVLVRVGKRFKEVFYDKDDNPRYRRFALAKILDIENDRDNDLIVDVTLCEGPCQILDEDMLDQITGGDELEDESVEERTYDEDNDAYFSLNFNQNQIKSSMQETALQDFSQITLLSPTQFLCFPWLGKGDYTLEVFEGITYYQSQFPGKSKYEIIDINKAKKVTAIEYIDVVQEKDNVENKLAVDDEKRLNEYRSKLKELNKEKLELLDKLEILNTTIEETKMDEGSIEIVEKEISSLKNKISILGFKIIPIESEISSILDIQNEKILQEKVKSEILLPKVLTNREEAIKALDLLNVFNKKVVNKLFPEDYKSFTKLMEELIKIFESAGFEKNIKDIIRNRVYGKHYLPGFQGLLDDNKLLAELRAIFGENCYTLLQGSVKLTKSSYNHFNKFISRNYNKADVADKSMMIFLMSTLMDTIESESSDGWFVDCLNEILNNIDNRINPEIETIILPVNPRSRILEYTEKDLFD